MAFLQLWGGFLTTPLANAMRAGQETGPQRGVRLPQNAASPMISRSVTVTNRYKP
jgi:hypothetical protein